MALFFDLPIDEQIKILIPILTEKYGSLENALKKVDEQKQELDFVKQTNGNISIDLPLNTPLKSGGTLKDLLPPGYQDTQVSLSQYSTIVNALIPAVKEDIAQNAQPSTIENRPVPVQNNTGQPATQQNNNTTNILSTVGTAAATVLIADQVFNNGQITTSIFGGTPSTTIDNTVPESDLDFDPRPQPDPFEVDGAGAGAVSDEDIQNADNPPQPDPYSQSDVGEVPDSEFLGAAPEGVSPYGEEDDPVDFSVADANPTPQPDPFEVDGAGAGDISAEDRQALDNPPDQPDPYEIDGAETSAAGLTEEGRQAEDNPVDDDPAYPQTDPGETPTNTESLADVQARQEEEAARQQAAVDRARAQAVLQQQRKQANDGDWRVKLRLAPLSTYLYNAADPGILQPLKDTDGVVFPYTPSINTSYTARYTPYDLTHSNYRGYFYQGSAVEEISIECPFTAQDTKEAEYLLAVIHFFRSATKMFYGQDAERGTPPPLVYLQGLGEYQFNLHPCVITSFNYNLPADVDYIRARSPNISSTGLLQKRIRQTTTTNPFEAVTQRLSSINAQPGAVATPPAPPTLGTNSPTYVPTRLEVSLRLLPIQTREQVSKQFSLKQFANGDLIKGGFW